MRGRDKQQEGMFSYISTEKRVPIDHPLRRVRKMTDAALTEMSAKFEELYSRFGRPSIAPEKLLRALLLQALYSVRSEGLLMEELNYNLLFRWFVGQNVDDEVWDVTVFTKNRERLLDGNIADVFFEQVLAQAKAHGLLSDEHFTVDGTMIEAWANRRSFREKKDPPARGSGSKGKKLLRDTHESKTDPEARLYKKSKAGEARPSYLGHLVMENRHGLVMKSCVTLSGTREEREAALLMLTRMVSEREAERKPGEKFRPVTVGGDKAYQEEKFIQGLRKLQMAPHIAEYQPNAQWPNWLTASERDDAGLAISQNKRKRIESLFGWIKCVAGLRKTKFRGRRRVDWMFTWAAAASNLIRLAKLIPAQA
jgi:transposase